MFRILYLNSFNIPKNSKDIVSKDLLDKADRRNSQMQKISKSSGKKSRKKELSQSIGLDYVGETKDSKLRILQDTFRNAKITGYLKLRRVVKRVFTRKKYFKEFFFILTNLGLLYFKKFGVSYFP
jgi:hypothetical protein